MAFTFFPFCMDSSCTTSWTIIERSVTSAAPTLFHTMARRFFHIWNSFERYLVSRISSQRSDEGAGGGEKNTKGKRTCQDLVARFHGEFRKLLSPMLPPLCPFTICPSLCFVSREQRVSLFSFKLATSDFCDFLFALLYYFTPFPMRPRDAPLLIALPKKRELGKGFVFILKFVSCEAGLLFE